MKKFNETKTYYIVFFMHANMQNVIIYMRLMIFYSQFYSVTTKKLKEVKNIQKPFS